VNGFKQFYGSDIDPVLGKPMLPPGRKNKDMMHVFKKRILLLRAESSFGAGMSFLEV
jgi:hypothetical protein